MPAQSQRDARGSVIIRVFIDIANRRRSYYSFLLFFLSLFFSLSPPLSLRLLGFLAAAAGERDVVTHGRSFVFIRAGREDGRRTDVLDCTTLIEN